MTDPRVLDAERAGALAALVVGREGYAIANPYYDTPTDPIAVFTSYHGAFGRDPDRMRRFADALLEASADPDRGWMVAYYVPDLLDHAEDFGPDFDAPVVTRSILERIHANAAYLQALLRWAGAGEPEGCWGVVSRYVRLIAAERGTELGDVVW